MKELTPLHRAILRGERELEAELNRILRDSTHAAAEALSSPFLSQHALVSSVLARHTQRIEAEAEEAIFEAAQRSRSRSWIALLIMLLGWKRARAAEEKRSSLRAEADRMRARASAKSLASLVGGRLVAELYGSGVSASSLLRQGPGLAKARIANIATTETAVTVSDEVRVSSASVAQMAGKPDVVLVHEWSALLDGRTCPYCRRMHGKRTATKEFEGGDWPPAHSQCRCVSIPLLIPIALWRAA